MTLSAGARLGPYEVLAPLGAGGMGEVWRARDTRLGRDVAIKVIPDALASDPKALHRFESEAKAVAALSHPNILSLFDVGESAGVHYAVTELLEGETLRALVAKGPVPVKRALAIAHEIAEGLAAAHEKGIVHRDLKPENVFLTRDGHAKVLDFGLARHETTFHDPGDTHSPTVSAFTEAGAVMGTFVYMSPEQASGKAVDHRSDQFSLGTVLYEMLAGKRPFGGETAAETLTAIIREEPEPLASLVPRVPAPLAWLVSRCLSKEPGERFDSTRDLAREIASWQLHLSEASSGSTATAAMGPGGRRVPARLVALLALAAVAAAAALFVAGTSVGRRSSRPPELRTQRLTFRMGTVRTARFAPDGHTVVYSAAWDDRPSEPFSVRLDGPESRPLGFPGADLLDISRTSEMALAVESREGPETFTTVGTLSLVPFQGGAAPRAIAERIGFADFLPDDSAMAVVREAEGTQLLEFPMGTVVHRPAPGWISDARVSPGGDLVAFLEHDVSVGEDNAGRVAIVDRSGRKRTLTERYVTAEGLAWAPGGREIWFTAVKSGLRMELRAVTLEGRERVVFRQTTGLRLHDVSPDGRVLATTFEGRARTFFREAGSTADRELSWHDWSIGTDLSPDGKLLAFLEGAEAAGPMSQVYVRASAGSPATKLGPGRWPLFSADGKYILTPLADVATIAVYPVGPGPVRTISLKGFAVDRGSLLPDGKTVWFRGNEGSRPTRIWLTDLSGTKPRPVTPEGSGNRVSPDGRYALGSFEGRRALYPLAGGAPVPVAGMDPGEYPVGWAADGETLYVCRLGEVPTRVFRLQFWTGRRDLVWEITPANRAGAMTGGPIPVCVSQDGRGCVYTTYTRLNDLYLVEGLR